MIPGAVAWFGPDGALYIEAGGKMVGMPAERWVSIAEEANSRERVPCDQRPATGAGCGHCSFCCSTF